MVVPETQQERQKMTKLPIAPWTAMQDKWLWPLFAGKLKLEADLGPEL